MTEIELKKIRFFFTLWIQLLCGKLMLRQRVIGTASVFFKRFYQSYSFCEVEPVSHFIYFYSIKFIMLEYFSSNPLDSFYLFVCLSHKSTIFLYLFIQALLSAAAVLLATKVEECNIRSILSFILSLPFFHSISLLLLFCLISNHLIFLAEDMIDKMAMLPAGKIFVYNQQGKIIYIFFYIVFYIEIL